MDIHAVDLDKTPRAPERLIYVGNYPRPYGINEQDTWNMRSYVAAVLANGLRMIMAYGHHVIDESAYDRIAGLLEFYATDHGDVLYEHIDWSRDNLDLWEGQPGFDEYFEKSVLMDTIKEDYIEESLAWLAEHWGELWD